MRRLGLLLVLALLGFRCGGPAHVTIYGDSLWSLCQGCAQWPPSWNATTWAQSGTVVWMRAPTAQCYGYGDPRCVNGEALTLDCVGHPESCLATIAPTTSVVLLQYGTNDFRRNDPDDTQRIRDAWDLILAELVALGLPFVIVNPPPILENANGQTCHEINAKMLDHWDWILPRIAAAGGSAVDAYAIFRAFEATRGEEAFLDLYVECPGECTDVSGPTDCIHPSAAGHALLGDIVFTALQNEAR